MGRFAPKNLGLRINQGRASAPIVSHETPNLENVIMTKRKTETNTAFVKRIMSRDILTEAFIIAAIDSYARHVAESEPIEHGFIDGAAWKARALSVVEELKNRH